MQSNFKASVMRDFNRSAANYDNVATLQKQVAERLFLLAKEFLNNCEVLDSGCGTGFLAKFCNENNISTNITGLDLAYNMCQLAKATSMQVVNSDFETMPFSDAAFDILFSSMALQWSKDFACSLSEIRRVLKKDGVVFLALVLDGSLVEIERCFNLLGKKQAVYKFMKLNEIKASVKNAGFKITSYEVVNLKQYFLSVQDLLNSIRGVGASYKNTGSSGNYLGKQFVRDFEAVYKKSFEDRQGLPLSWNILLFSGRR